MKGKACLRKTHFIFSILACGLYLFSLPVLAFSVPVYSKTTLCDSPDIQITGSEYVCAGGDALLMASSGHPGADFYWFRDATGTELLSIGDSFTIDSILEDTVLYVQAVIDDTCRSKIIAYEIVVDSLPPIALFEYCNRGDYIVDFVDKGLHARSWIWDFGSPGEPPRKAFNPRKLYQQPSDYLVRMYVENGCAKDTFKGTIFVYKDSTACTDPIPLGIEGEAKSKLTLTLYPNPVSHTLHVAFNNVSFSGNLEILNAQGKLLEKFVIDSSRPIDIDLENYVSGLYHIRITDTRNHHTATRLFLKE